jgi:hypothetical protein
MRYHPNTILSIEEPSPNPAAIGILEWNCHGSCAICGDETGTVGTRVLARYWDCDDGWMLGKLCPACVTFCRPPHPDDYAYDTEGDAFGFDPPEDVL